MFCLLLMISPLKEEIASLERSIEVSVSADLYYSLAKAHLKDQEQDRAFLSFLEALDASPKKEGLELPKEALDAYMVGKPPTELGDLATNFIVSISLANEGHFDLFFEHFFAAYPYFKGSFLDFKTRGILYLRLSKKATSKKQIYLNEAEKNLQSALELQPDDASIYRSLILLAKDAKKRGDVLGYLEKLKESDAHLLRTDVLFYVQEALALDRREIAEVIVEKGKQLYSYSRSIEAAEKLLGNE